MKAGTVTRKEAKIELSFAWSGRYLQKTRIPVIKRAEKERSWVQMSPLGASWHLIERGGKNEKIERGDGKFYHECGENGGGRGTISKKVERGEGQGTSSSGGESGKVQGSVKKVNHAQGFQLKGPHPDSGMNILEKKTKGGGRTYIKGGFSGLSFSISKKRVSIVHNRRKLTTRYKACHRMQGSGE